MKKFCGRCAGDAGYHNECKTLKNKNNAWNIA